MKLILTVFILSFLLRIQKNINEILVSEKTYETVLSKECEVTGNMHDRHKVRWIKYQFSNQFIKKQIK